MSACIFCFRQPPEIQLSREHVIPSSIRGILIVEDMICTQCNSELGARVDAALVSDSEVVQALSTVVDPANLAKLLNRNYEISGIGDEITLRGRATDGGVLFHSQTLHDGSKIHPERDMPAILLKGLLRDENLRNAGMKEAQIRQEHRRLIEAYSRASPGEIVDWPKLGRRLLKRSDSLKVQLRPRSAPSLDPLAGKVAYEFGYLIGGRDFLMSVDLAQSLFALVCGIPPASGTEVFRLRTGENPNPYHCIEFFPRAGHTEFTVVLFGSIVLRILAPKVDHRMFADIESRFGLKGMEGIEFQQNIEENSFAFRAVLEGGEFRTLAVS